jgi:hypothetical protein
MLAVLASTVASTHSWRVEQSVAVGLTRRFVDMFVRTRSGGHLSSCSRSWNVEPACLLIKIYKDMWDSLSYLGYTFIWKLLTKNCWSPSVLYWPLIKVLNRKYMLWEEAHWTWFVLLPHAAIERNSRTLTSTSNYIKWSVVGAIIRPNFDFYEDCDVYLENGHVKPWQCERCNTE